MTGPDLLITMTDIAALARVQRPVVSVWRTRAAHTDTPFPPSISQRGGQDLFDAHQVATWLADTRRGNNPEAVADAAAHAFVESTAGSDAPTLAAVTALLALRSALGSPLGANSDAQLLDLADEHDPDDELFYREIEKEIANKFESGGAARSPLIGYVDALVESAYGEAPAFELLMANRQKLGNRALRDTVLSGSALELVAHTAVALAATLASDPVFVDATGCASDIILAIDRAEPTDLTVVTANGDTEPARLLRRRLLVHSIVRESLDVDDSGAFTVTGTAVHVAHFPSAADVAMTAQQILSAIDHIVLQMHDEQLAVIVAPSTVLSDGGLGRQAEALRSDILRSGRVRAVVRLPLGLVPHKPKQAQTLWVLGATHAEVELAERWTMVADLGTVALDPVAIHDLVSDLVASLGDRATVRAHSFRFARLMLTRTLLASRGSLVAGVRVSDRPPAKRGAALAVQVENLLGALTEAPSETDAANGIDRISVEPASAASRPATQTVEQLVAARHLRYVPGNRLEGGDEWQVDKKADAVGIRIIGAAEVFGEHPLGNRRIDSLRFAADYPAGRLTEPGDVVFCTTPRPAAIVDTEGTSVVAFPARILRINPGDPNGLVGEVVAADITALQPAHRRWQQWPLRGVQQRQRGALGDALSSVRWEQQQALDRLAQLTELSSLLMTGVASGALELTQVSEPSAPKEGTP